MKHKVPWNRTLLEDFIKEGLLTEDEEFIMRNGGYGSKKMLPEHETHTDADSKIHEVMGALQTLFCGFTCC